MTAEMIETVQVREVTAFVPPGSLEFLSTVVISIVIVVSIFGAERHATMIRKRVTSISYLKKHLIKKKSILSRGNS